MDFSLGTGSKITHKSKAGADTDTFEKTTKSTINAVDLESIKNYVQEISKNANPIGKTIDFLQDDIESMNKELQSWISEGKNYKEKYEEEIK